MGRERRGREVGKQREEGERKREEGGRGGEEEKEGGREGRGGEGEEEGGKKQRGKMVEEWRKRQKEGWSVKVNFFELLITSPSPLPHAPTLSYEGILKLCSISREASYSSETDPRS